VSLGQLGERDLGLASRYFVDKYKALMIASTKLSIGVKELHATYGAVRGEIDIYFITQPNSFHRGACPLA
jgi:hypothetical protein